MQAGAWASHVRETISGDSRIWTRKSLKRASSGCSILWSWIGSGVAGTNRCPYGMPASQAAALHAKLQCQLQAQTVSCLESQTSKAFPMAARGFLLSPGPPWGSTAVVSPSRPHSRQSPLWTRTLCSATHRNGTMQRLVHPDCTPTYRLLTPSMEASHPTFFLAMSLACVVPMWSLGLHVRL